jgi:hypothetical protein
VVGLVVAAGSQMLGQGGRRRSTVIRGLLLAVLCGTAAYLLYGLQLVRPETWGLLPEATWAGRLALAALVCAASLLPLGLVWRWDG